MPTLKRHQNVTTRKSRAASRLWQTGRRQWAENGKRNKNGRCGASQVTVPTTNLYEVLIRNRSSYSPYNFDSEGTAQEFIPLTSSLCNPYTHYSWELNWQNRHVSVGTGFKMTEVYTVLIPLQFGRSLRQSHLKGHFYQISNLKSADNPGWYNGFKR